MSPAAGCGTTSTGVANRNKPGVTNFTVYRGDKSTGPIYKATQVYPPSSFTGPLPAGGPDFVFDSDRLPNGLYNWRTSIQERSSTGTCALGTASTALTSDPFNVTLANVGAIDSISGTGSSGTTATVTARLVDGTTHLPYVTSGGPAMRIMRTKGYSVLGVNFTVGNGGTPAGSAVDGYSFPSGVAATKFPVAGNTGFKLYVDGPTGIDAFAPGIADGETKIRFNRLTVTSTDGPQTVECTTVFKNTTSALTGADKFNGFDSCYSNGTGSMIAPEKQADGTYTGGSTVIEGHAPATLTFTINGHSSEPVTVDRVTGIATGEVATPDVPVGHNYPVTVTSSDDGFLKSVTAAGAIDFKGASTTTYTGAQNAFWDEDFPVSATVASTIGNTPATDGTVVFSRGTQVSEPVPVVDGVAEAILHAADAPSAGQKVTATYSGTELFNPSSDAPNFTTKPRPTTVQYTGATVGKYNDNVTFVGKLTDNRRGGAPIAGEKVAFKLGTSDAVSATTGADGVASTSVPVASKVGTYDLKTDFFAVARYVASSATTPFAVDFQYKFTDKILGNYGTWRLNPDTQQVAFTNANGHSTNTADDAYQLSLFLPKTVGYPEQPGVPGLGLPSEWGILNLPRLSDLFGVLASPPTVTPPAVTPPTVPALPVGELPIAIPMTASSNARYASANASGSPIGAPSVGSGGVSLPTDGMTLGELINSVATAGIPTSLSECELLSGSICERRFIIAAATSGPDMVGVFDVKNGVFASLATNAPWANPGQLGAGLGNCLKPLQPLCLAAPKVPGKGPKPTAPTLPSASALQAAIANLAAGLQAIPGQITAPPAPPTPEVPAPMAASASPSPVAPLPTKSVVSTLPTYWLG